VADQGVGLAPADQKRVFDRFFRAGDEMTRRVSGSGLGLFLAREIIKAHGGRITIRSDGPGKGAIVEIRLPLHGAEPAGAGQS
jgi:two-component system sensor histidine kinase BaeS